jgi:hypothetical protein
MQPIQTDRVTQDPTPALAADLPQLAEVTRLRLRVLNLERELGEMTVAYHQLRLAGLETEARALVEQIRQELGLPGAERREIDLATGLVRLAAEGAP